MADSFHTHRTLHVSQTAVAADYTGNDYGWPAYTTDINTQAPYFATYGCNRVEISSAMYRPSPSPSLHSQGHKAPYCVWWRCMCVCAGSRGWLAFPIHLCALRRPPAQEHHSDTTSKTDLICTAECRYQVNLDFVPAGRMLASYAFRCPGIIQPVEIGARG